MPSILVIDQSTSATKGVLFDAAGNVRDCASREHRQWYPRPGWVEHDAEEIWQNVLVICHEIVCRFSNLKQLAGLALTNQRETFIVFERHTGKPLTNAVVWQCRRGEATCRELQAAGWEEVVVSKTGLKLDTYFSGPKLRHLLHESPGLEEKIRCGDALVGTMDTYLIYRLTGGDVYATDHTNASRTLLYNIAKLNWDEQLCELFNISIRALGEVRESIAQFGTTNAGGALPHEVPICGVMGDSQASLFAQTCYEPGMTKVTFGSGSSVLQNIGHEFRRPSRGAVAALAWVLEARPTYSLEGIINYSSATVAWLKDQLGLIASASESEALASSVSDNGGVYLVPAFAGLSAPHWRPEARAAIIGMTAHTRSAHIVRAALEAIAYQIRDVLEMMRQETGVAPRVLRADGGPTRNKFLMQFAADVAGLELDVAKVAESSAWGAAMAGFLGLGIVSSLDELAGIPRTSIRYRPTMTASDAAGLYAGWQAAVKRVI